MSPPGDADILVAGARPCSTRSTRYTISVTRSSSRRPGDLPANGAESVQLAEATKAGDLAIDRARSATARCSTRRCNEPASTSTSPMTRQLALRVAPRRTDGPALAGAGGRRGARIAAQPQRNPTHAPRRRVARVAERQGVGRAEQPVDVVGVLVEQPIMETFPAPRHRGRRSDAAQASSQARAPGTVSQSVFALAA